MPWHTLRHQLFDESLRSDSRPTVPGHSTIRRVLLYRPAQRGHGRDRLQPLDQGLRWQRWRFSFYPLSTSVEYGYEYSPEQWEEAKVLAFDHMLMRENHTKRRRSLSLARRNSNRPRRSTPGWGTIYIGKLTESSASSLFSNFSSSSELSRGHKMCIDAALTARSVWWLRVSLQARYRAL